MRIPEVIVTPPVIIIGWISSIFLLAIIIKFIPKLSNKELTKMSLLGGFIFVISSIPLPLILPFPILFNLSGVSISLLLFGAKKGSLVASGAMILNHILIPGSLSALGLNLTNMIIISLLLGVLSHKAIGLTENTRIHYLIAFFTGFLYIILETGLILSELASMHTTDSDINIFLQFLKVYIPLIGGLEGLFTAISFSYYKRTSISQKRSVMKDLNYSIEEGDRDDLHLDEEKDFEDETLDMEGDKF